MLLIIIHTHLLFFLKGVPLINILKTQTNVLHNDWKCSFSFGPFKRWTEVIYCVVSSNLIWRNTYFHTEWQGVCHYTHSCNGVTGMGEVGLGTRCLHEQQQQQKTKPKTVTVHSRNRARSHTCWDMETPNARNTQRGQHNSLPVRLELTFVLTFFAVTVIKGTCANALKPKIDHSHKCGTLFGGQNLLISQ